MNKLTLHSFRRCPFAIRARMVLEEKGLAFHCIEEDLSNFSAELLALHPEGRVPLLIHEAANGKKVIYQSTVITEYLDEAFPQNKLMPETPAERADVRLWTYWCDAIFKPDLDLFKYELKTMSAEEASALQTRLHEHLKTWDKAVEESGYLVGEKFGLADIHLFPFARQFLRIKPQLAGVEAYKNLESWLVKITQRPAFLKVMEK